MTATPGRTLDRFRALARALAAAATLALLLTGIPYVLLHQARSWQPTRVPSWDAVTTWLQFPYDTVVLLQLLDCACWMLWLWLAAQTIVELVWYAAHARDLLGPAAGSSVVLAARRTLAGMLIAALVLGIAAALRTSQPPGQRTDLATAAWTTRPAAAAPAVPGTTLRTADMRVCTVKEGDNLWDLAARHLGDPLRWPEIYQLNAHRPQADGRALTDPDLIYPHWTLRLPTKGADPAPVTGTAPPPPAAVNGPASAAPSPTAAPTQPPIERPAPSADRPHAAAAAHPHGIELTSAGGYISLTLAAALSATALTVMRRRRRGYQPEDLTAPQRPRPKNPEETGLIASLRRSTDLHPDTPAASASAPGRLPVAAAATGGEVTLLDLLADQAVPALTLTGEGALDAARALLVTVLADPGTPHRLIVNREDLTLLITDRTPAPGGALQVTDSPQSSIDALEEALLHRARHRHEHDLDDTPDQTGLVILLGRTATHTRHRLSALLTASHGRGLAAVLLHNDPTTGSLPGAAFRIAAGGQAARLKDDGTLATPLRMFHLPTGSTEILCTLLAHDREFDHVATAASEESQPPAPEEPEEFPSGAIGVIPPHAEQNSSASALLAGTRPTVALLHDDAEPPPAPEAEVADSSTSARQLQPAPAPVPVPLPDPDLPGEAETRCPVQVKVMGPLRVLARERAVTKGMAGSAGELLAYLALHPKGATKDSIEEALWPERTPDKREEAFNTAKKTVRKHLRDALGGMEAMFIVNSGPRWRLDPQQVTTDYTAFHAAVQRSCTALDTAARLQACRTVADLYTETLCEGSDFTWATAPREDARRRTLNALSTLATAAAAAHDTDSAMQILTEALTHDPHSEELHLRLARLHAARGETDAIRRLLDQLTANHRAIGERTTSPTTAEFHSLLRSSASAAHRASPPVRHRRQG
ncbi:DNA-binding SARP family transcriptional activator [Streptacidiphilus sp. MAP12-16]|uniref:tetratricopeptide repeat protein n=1 Tax=Streptacidiphilus sp. MAP12-16 TaxID=3156300 RepID=UPI0035156873